MNWLFLVSETFNEALSEGLGGIIGAVFSIIIGIFFIVFLLSIGIYVYSSLAYMAIGKKAKDEKAWLAWIPVVGKPLLTSRIAKMPWWPVLLLLGAFFSFIPLFGGVISIVSSITFSVFFFIWRWKAYEKVGHPGWFSLFFLLPIVGYVFLGIVAWSKENIIEPIKVKKK